jgi:protein SCO1/2
MTEGEVPSVAEPSRSLRTRRLIVGGLTLLGFALGAAYLAREKAPPPAVLGEAPRFELRDERAQPFGSRDLLGHPYVADFIYTSCTDSCPKLTAAMAALQDLLAGDPSAVRLVTFTVDPRNDTPQKLAAYARTAGAVEGRWVFLTGEPDEVSRIVEEGFHVAMPGPGEKLHDNHLVVVDGRGRLRGYYPADAAGRHAIRAALKQLILGE